MNIVDQNSRLNHNEHRLIQELERTPMRLDPTSRYFSIKDLASNGTQVIVEEGLHCIRKKSYSIQLSEKERKECEAKIESLSALIDEYYRAHEVRSINEIDECSRGHENTPIDESMLLELRKELDLYKRYLDMDGQIVEFEMSLLGEYIPSSDTIKLYIDNIEKSVAGNRRANRESVVISTLVHEFFHAFYHKNCQYGNTAKPSVTAVDEAMVEFSMLTYLAYVAERKQSLTFDVVFKVAFDSVKEKKFSEGDLPAYGFGSFIYERCCDSAKSIRPTEWILQYLERYGDIDASAPNVKSYVNMVFPFYRKDEIKTFCYIVDVIFSGDRWQGTNTSKMIAELDCQMQYTCKFIFKKNDGTIRIAAGTRNQTILDNLEYSGTGRPTPASVYAYFDYDKEEWRSFRRNSLLAILS